MFASACGFVKLLPGKYSKWAAFEYYGVVKTRENASET